MHCAYIERLSSIFTVPQSAVQSPHIHPFAHTFIHPRCVHLGLHFLVCSCPQFLGSVVWTERESQGATISNEITQFPQTARYGLAACSWTGCRVVFGTLQSLQFPSIMASQCASGSPLPPCLSCVLHDPWLKSICVSNRVLISTASSTFGRCGSLFVFFFVVCCFFFFLRQSMTARMCPYLPRETPRNLASLSVEPN